MSVLPALADWWSGLQWSAWDIARVALYWSAVAIALVWGVVAQLTAVRSGGRS